MKRVIGCVPILVALAFAAPIALAAGSGLAVQPGRQLWLTGSSTIHAYSITATKLDVTFTVAAAGWHAGPGAGEAIEKLIRERGVSTLGVVVGVAGMHSGKDGLDKNMRKALLAEKYPQIRFTMTSYDVAEGTSPGTLSIDARGKLSVAGVEREVRVPVTAKRDGDAVRLTADVPLLMTQFGIKPPTMMMGTVRTADQIVVHIDLRVGAEGPTTAARP